MSAIGLVSVRHRVQAVIVAVALPFAAAIGFFWWQSLQYGQALSSALLRSSASMVERDLQSLHRKSEWVMSNMARRPDVRALRPSACDSQMAVMREADPAYLAITLWARDGSLVCSTIPPPANAPSPKPHHDSFVTGLATEGLYLSDVFIGEITGQRLVAYTYPVRTDNNEAIGLLSIPMRLDIFEDSLLRLPLQPGGRAGIRDRNGVLVAQVVDAANLRAGAKDVAAGTERQEDAAGLAGVAAGSEPGKQFLVRTAVRGTGWQIHIGADRELLFAVYNRQRVIGVALLVLVFGLGLGYAVYVGRRVSRPVEDLVTVADAVAGGDRSRRADAGSGDEIGRLATHFNTMLDTLATTHESMQNAQQRLQALSDQLLLSQEAERSRLARELHDEFGQTLSVTKLQLQRLAQEGPSARLEDCIAMVDQCLQQVRRLSLDLRPSQLDDLGLAIALETAMTRLSRQAGVAIETEIAAGFPRLVGERAIGCYRIAQEAVSNALRHSAARFIRVRLQLADNHIEIAVSDDGAGFDAAAMRAKAIRGRSLGLLSMEERAAMFGGTLTVQSSSGAGTAVHARIPLESPPRPAFEQSDGRAKFA